MITEIGLALAGFLAATARLAADYPVVTFWVVLVVAAEFVFEVVYYARHGHQWLCRRTDHRRPVTNRHARRQPIGGSW